MLFQIIFLGVLSQRQSQRVQYPTDGCVVKVMLTVGKPDLPEQDVKLPVMGYIVKAYKTSTNRDKHPLLSK